MVHIFTVVQAVKSHEILLRKVLAIGMKLPLSSTKDVSRLPNEHRSLMWRRENGVNSPRFQNNMCLYFHGFESTKVTYKNILPPTEMLGM